MGLDDLVNDLDMYPEFEDVLEGVSSISELEQVVREHDLFNMWD